MTDTVKKYLLLSVWLILLGIGLTLLWSYQFRPGTIILSSESAGPEAFILDSNLPTLVMFAHPQCPCSRASVAELTKILSIFPKKFNTKIYFYYPSGKELSWVKSSLWKNSINLPGTELFIDNEGALAKKFQAKISGEVFALNPDNKILYHGGITPSRGHQGDSIGKTSLLEIAQRGSSKVIHGPVFGCGLFRDE